MKGNKPKNILIICEGSTEQRLFRKIFEVYPISVEVHVYLYKTNVHLFAKHLIEKYLDAGFTVDDIDIIQVLKEIKTNSVLDRKYTDILLVFDFDPHDARYSEERISRMLKLFDESTDQGKLYINYPMVESAFDFHALPDPMFIYKDIDKSTLFRSGYKNIIRGTSVIRDVSDLDSTSLPVILRQTQEKMYYLVGDTDDSYFQLLQLQIKKLRYFDKIFIINTSLLFLRDYNPQIFNEFTNYLDY